MIAMQSYLDSWTDEQYEVLENATLLARHRLHESGMFTDEALCELIARHPDDYLTIAAMGNEASRFEWMTGKRGDCSPEELLEVVKSKQIWVNLIRLGRFHPEYQRIVDSIYDELESKNPSFKAQHRSSNLLISSPNAIVYYHIDLPVNMLWHIRGEKQVWVYPLDARFVSQKNLERFIMGEMAEDLPYETWMDDFAVKFHVTPGQMLTWPQNTPHRVTNLDCMNVSLSTEHRNPTAKRRINVNLANAYLRRQFRFENLSSDMLGFQGRMKEFYARSVRIWDQVIRKKELKPFDYRKRFEIDPTAEMGYVMLDQNDDGTCFEEEMALLVQN